MVERAQTDIEKALKTEKSTERREALMVLQKQIDAIMEVIKICKIPGFQSTEFEEVPLFSAERSRTIGSESFFGLRILAWLLPPSYLP